MVLGAPAVWNISSMSVWVCVTGDTGSWKRTESGNWCFPQKANSSHSVSEFDSRQTTTTRDIFIRVQSLYKSAIINSQVLPFKSSWVTSGIHFEKRNTNQRHNTFFYSFLSQNTFIWDVQMCQPFLSLIIVLVCQLSGSTTSWKHSTDVLSPSCNDLCVDLWGSQQTQIESELDKKIHLESCL